jgi:hypothetical protein
MSNASSNTQSSANPMSNPPGNTKTKTSWNELMSARWFRVLVWIVGSFVGLFVLLYGWGFYLINIEPRFAPYGPYNIVGFNYTDRPVHTFSVNRKWGGNVLAGDSGGGGGTTCCIDIDRDAKTVVVRWEWAYTGPQLAEKFPQFDLDKPTGPVPSDRFETTVDLPELPEGSDGFIGVHFFPDQVVKITYSDDIPRPIQKIEQTLIE